MSDLEDLLEGLDQAVSIDPPEIIGPLLEKAAAAIRALEKAVAQRNAVIVTARDLLSVFAEYATPPEEQP